MKRVNELADLVICPGAEIARKDIREGDWVHLAADGFDVYGKVIIHDDETGTVEMVTSTITKDRSKVQPGGGWRGDFKKILAKDVPNKARLWILARISHPPKPGKIVKAPEPPVG